nr:MAG TPA: Protein of unknown function (DUF2746) [Caudoviricetes sp.]
METMITTEMLNVVVSLITTLGAIWISTLKLKKDIADTKREVTNKHNIHLRDDIDNKHNDVVTLIQNLIVRVSKLEKTDTIINEKLSRLEHTTEYTKTDLWEAVNGLKEKYIIYEHGAKRAKDETWR